MTKPILTICCLPNQDSFLADLKHALSNFYTVRECVSGDLATHARAIQESDAVWIEWGNELAVAITRHLAELLRTKRVYLRIHSYEVLDDICFGIDFTPVTDLVFVANHIRELFLAKQHRPAGARIHTLPNCVNVRRFASTEPPDTREGIALLATMNFKKDPMVALHAYASYVHAGGSEKLYVAGGFQQIRYEIGFKNFLTKNNLDERVSLVGWIDNVSEWLASKRFILCSSLQEGHPVGLLEAMAAGVHPLIYSWYGAERIYPPQFLWASMHEFCERALSTGPRPSPVQYVEDAFSMECLEIYTSLIVNAREDVDIFERCIRKYG